LFLLENRVIGVPSAASANNTKNCLASWLHSAKTEAIACRSKVIAGRIYDAGNFVAPSNASRNFSEMSRVNFTREDLDGTLYQRQTASHAASAGRQLTGRLKRCFAYVSFGERPLPSTGNAQCVAFSPEISPYRRSGLLHRRGSLTQSKVVA
jgi:hypothetical protein